MCVEARGAEGEVGGGDGICEERAVDELIHQHLGGDDVPGISSAEPVILAAVEEVHEHSEAGPEGRSGEEVPEIGQTGAAFLKKDNAEQLGKKSPGDDVGRERKSIAQLLTQLPHPCEEGLGAVVKEIGCEEAQHERLEQEARQQVGTGGAEAGLKSFAKGHAAPDSKKRTPVRLRAW